MAKRVVWWVTGAAMGAATSLWAERRLRRSVQQAAARLQPDAIVAEVGRSARQAAETTGERVRDALWSGRDEMLRREEELWAELAGHGAHRDALGRVGSAPDASARRPAMRHPGAGGRAVGRRRGARRDATTTGAMAPSAAKPPLHLGN